MLAAGQHAAEQDGGVNGRNLAMAVAFARPPVHEMIKETMLVRHGVPQKAKRHPGALPGCAGGQPPPLVGNAKPVAAMLEMAASLGSAWWARFIIMPVSGWVRSQKSRKLACSSSSRNASSPGENPGVGIGLVEAFTLGTMAPPASVARPRAV